MRKRFGWLAEFLARRVFSHVVVNEAAVAKIRELSAQGTVVYALRHRSIVDYFLVNCVLRREGLPLPVFANGVTLTLFSPVADLLRRIRQIIEARLSGDADGLVGGHDYCARAVERGEPVLIFMRGRRSRRGLGRLSPPVEPSRVGSDYLREIVHGRARGGREVFLVPLALFRGHSFHRRDPGHSTLVYSAQDAPSEPRRLLTYLWNRRDLFITVGKEVAVGEFMHEYPSDGVDTLVRRLTRAIQIFLHREERVVLGPALLSRRQVKSLVLETSEMDTELRGIARERQLPVSRLRKEAESYFDEMVADFNGILFACVAFVFKKMWSRMFSGIEPIGFEKVIEKVRDHPVVLVPCHRSHLDYLIITYLCHLNFVSPPHIFAGINMAFWPMAPLLRACGAFFVRRTFADNPLYKAVFRRYLMFLIREGYTQEFFIEGGRSRTGKMMTPRLGMLSAIVDAQLSGVHRDVYLCPVSIHYGRIVEEDAYQAELIGAEKEAESFGALLRARRFLKQKYGTVYVSFADPISLDGALGELKGRFSAEAGNPQVEEERRRFVQQLGFRILREVNGCSVAGATSISATVMLAASHRGKLYEEYAAQANALAGLIKYQGITPTASLERNIGSFRESLAFLRVNDLIELIRRGRDEVLVVREEKRLALDFYKNNLIHAFLVPSLVAFCLIAGRRREEWLDEIWWWLDLFRYEFALPRRSELPAMVERFERYYVDQGAVRDGTVDLKHPLIRATVGALDNFREAYWLAARTVATHVARDGVSEKQIQDLYRKDYEASILIGEAQKPEGATVVILGNALSRFEEMGLVKREARRRAAKERVVHLGREAGALGPLIERLAQGVEAGRLREG
jgi:glycerol-3-phosphate O-acyltransferase